MEEGGRKEWRRPSLYTCKCKYEHAYKQNYKDCTGTDTDTSTNTNADADTDVNVNTNTKLYGGKQRAEAHDKRCQDVEEAAAPVLYMLLYTMY